MANLEQLEILKQGFEVWNKWREDNPDAEIDLSEADLHEAKLFRANLTGAILTGANLNKATLKRANLSGADLSNADLTETYLIQADLFDTKLREGSTGADVEQLKLLKSDVDSWNQWREEKRNVLIDLRKADLRDADLRKANLDWCILLKADLSNAKLSEAHLWGADLREAILNKADLSHTSLNQAHLTGAILTGANLSYAFLSGVDLTGVDLTGVDLIGADLVGTKLRDGSTEADVAQLKILKQGVHVWNKWRKERQGDLIDLRHADLNGEMLWGANLEGAHLERANLEVATLRGANLEGATLRYAKLSRANLAEAILKRAIFFNTELREAQLDRAHLGGARLEGAHLGGARLEGARLERAHLERAHLGGARLEGARLEGARLEGADLNRAHLEGAHLEGANLHNANLNNAILNKALLNRANLINVDLVDTDLSEADLTGADLSQTDMVRTNVEGAILNNCNVYGASVWDLQGEFKEQKNLVITKKGEPEITVDNIKVAQFVYLILNNKEIRDVLNTLTSKTVLILGRFALPERKVILDSLRNKLREYDLLPIVFDFERPDDKDFTETIKTLAGMCYFVIADVTNPKSSPLELQATVPDYQIPFVPIIQEGESPFAMMVDLQKKYGLKNGGWVLETIEYDSLETLMGVLKDMVIDPAIKRHNELKVIKASNPEIKSAKDFLKQKQSQQNS